MRGRVEMGGLPGDDGNAKHAAEGETLPTFIIVRAAEDHSVLCMAFARGKPCRTAVGGSDAAEEDGGGDISADTHEVYCGDPKLFEV